MIDLLTYNQKGIEKAFDLEVSTGLSPVRADTKGRHREFVTLPIRCISIHFVLTQLQ